MRNNNLSYNLNRSNGHVDVDSNSYWGSTEFTSKKEFESPDSRTFKYKLHKISETKLISEAKLDDSFPSMQFLIEGYGSPYRLDRNSHGGGILVYVREDIPCKLIPMKNYNRRLISCSYNPHRTFFLTVLSSRII